MISSYMRGHLVKTTVIEKTGANHFKLANWVWADTGIPIAEIKDRPCKRCGKWPTPEGYDACLGYIPGVAFACCGHGVEPGYVQR